MHADAIRLADDRRHVDDADDEAAGRVTPQPAEYAVVAVVEVDPFETVAREVDELLQLRAVGKDMCRYATWKFG